MQSELRSEDGMPLGARSLDGGAGLATCGGTKQVSVAGMQEVIVFPNAAHLATAAITHRTSRSRCSEVLVIFSECSGKESMRYEAELL